MGTGANAWKDFLEKKRIKNSNQIGADKICDATLQGENEMGIKETLNCYGYGISA